MSNTCTYDLETIKSKIKETVNSKLETNRSLGNTFEGFYNVLRNTILEMIRDNEFQASLMSDEDKLKLVKGLKFKFANIFAKFRVLNFSEDKTSELLSALSLVTSQKNPASEKDNPKISDRTLLTGRLEEKPDDKDFLGNAYLNSPRARMYAENLGRELVVKSFLYTEETTESGIRKTIIGSLCELERAILNTLQKLLNKIVEYILSSGDEVLKLKIKEYNEKRKGGNINEETILKHLQDPIIFDPNKPNRLGSFVLLQRYFGDYFTRPGDLEDLIDNINQDNPDVNKKLILDAYNSYILLLNFDEFVKLLFGDLINIDRQKPKFSPNRYKLKNEGSNLFTTFRTTDEIWLDKEINKVAQLIITTTRKYNLLTKTPLENEYLTFNGFVRSVGKLKTLMKGTINPSSQSELKFALFKELNSNISQKTKNYIEEHNIKSMRQLVCSSRVFPETAWEAIFDILANTDSISTLNELFGATPELGFQREDLNNYYSIWKELIGSNSSLSSGVNSTIAKSSYNYASYLTLVIDSMFETSYLQYYVSENGDIEIRPLRSMIGYRFRRAKERAINNQLSLIRYRDLKEQFNIKVEVTDGKALVKFKIGDAEIQYNPRVDGYGLTITGNLKLTKEVTELILGINISSDIIKGLNNTLSNPRATPYSTAEDVIQRLPGLKDLVLKAIARTAINNELLRFTDNSGNETKIEGNPLNSKSKLATKIKGIYGTDIEINTAARGTVIIDGKGKRGGTETSLLEALAYAELYSQGLVTSSQIKSADGTSVSANALSRLADSYPHQWYYQNLKPNSASKHFILLNNPAFLGLFQVKELEDENSILASEDMTEADMITSNFIHDFLGQLNKGLNENKIMYIIPLVISDKKFIGRLGINLSEEIDLFELGFPEIHTWEDIINSPKYSDIITAIIQHDFSIFFYNIYNNINEDFKRVEKNVSKVLPQDIISLIYGIYEYNIINEQIQELLNDEKLLSILRTKYGIENVTSDLIENLLDNKYYSIVNIYEFETGRPLDIFNPSILTDNNFLNALNIVYHKNIIDLNELLIMLQNLRELSKLPSWELLAQDHGNLDPDLYANLGYLAGNIPMFEDFEMFNSAYNDAIRTHNQRIISSIVGLEKYVKSKISEESSVYDTIISLNKEEFTNLLNTFSEVSGISVNPNIYDLFVKLTATQLLYETTKSYNIEHPATPIELIDLVHFIGESDGTISRNPVLVESLKRFKDTQSVKEFFEQQTLITASNMIDKRFSYTISKENIEVEDDSKKSKKDEKPKGKIDTSIQKVLKNGSWITKSGKVIISRIKAQVNVPKVGLQERTFEITDRVSLRNILEFIDKSRTYKSGALIERDIMSQILTSELIQEAEKTTRKQLTEEGKSEEDILKNLLYFSNKVLFPLYIEAVKTNLTLEEINIAKQLHPEQSEDNAINSYIQRQYFILKEKIQNETNKQKNRDRQKTLELVIKDNPDISVELNPFVYKYSTLDYLFSEEWIASTVGHHYAHPDKKYNKDNMSIMEYIIQTEANRKEALNKRNVSVTATMHEFELNTLSGIPSMYNIATVKDIKDVLYNVYGLIDAKVKPYDGATFVNPFIVYLENNSLGGSKAGIVKKLFVHFYNERTGSGGIIKTAGFGATNMLAKNSERWMSMIKSMTDREWVATQNIGSYKVNDRIGPQDANILQGFDGKEIQYPTVYFKNESGQFIQREILEYEGNYSYRVRDIIVDPTNGNMIPDTKIDEHSISGVNTNYKVWKLFGGEWSYELTNSGKLVPSEQSIALTVMAMNNVGIKLNDNEESKTQSDVYQFMKHSDIHYIATEGAVKQGAANINSINSYSDGGQLNFQRVRMLQAGIQLDKEHSADGEDVSLMTQVISACVSRGFTFDKADKLYKALAKIAEIGLGDSLTSIRDFIHNETKANKQLILEAVVDAYLKALSTDSNPNVLATKIASSVIQQLNSGRKVSSSRKIGLLPFSDPGIYNLFISKLSVAITKAAIKIKVDGVLSMLCPSFGILKLYNGKMLGEYMSPEELLAAQLEANKINYKDSIGQINIGTTYNITYKDGTTEKLLIQTPQVYYNLRKKLSNIESIVENVTEGRDLAHYNCFFKSGTKTYGIYDLESIRNLYEARQKKAPKQELIQKQKLLLKDLLNLKKGGIVKVLEGDGVAEVEITKIDKLIPYEVILPKFFLTSFGLDSNDNLSEINEEYFFLKLREKFIPQILDGMFDVCLKRANGDHVYIKLKSRPRNILQQEIKIDKRIEKDKIYRKDPDTGEDMYELSSRNDNVLLFTDLKGRSFEIIETDNIEHYLKTQNGVWDMYISSSSDYLTLVENYSKGDIKPTIESDTLNNYLKYFRKSKLSSILEYNRLMRDGNVSETLDVTGYKLKLFRERAKRMYSSFLKALELVAARIPSQSMLSFMPMRIVGFDNSGTNTAYVSTAQIWLQGSDFDIDTATFTRFATGNDGQFVHWSGLADLRSYEVLKACDELPFPTGQVCNREVTGAMTGKTFVIHDMRNPFLNIFINDEENTETVNLLVINNIDLLGNGLAVEEKVKKLCLLIEFVNKNGVNNLTYIDSTGTEKRLTVEQYKFVADLVDKHNTWLFKKSNDYQLDAIKNFLLTQMYDIIISPSNLIQALTPVDTATDIVKEPLKDETLKDAVLAAKAIPGDPTVKVTGIYKNQTGKKGVGICATALKSYFAAFLQNQSVLGNKLSSTKELKRLVLGRSGIKIKDKTYYGLANVYCPRGIDGTELREISDIEAQSIANRIIEEQNNPDMDNPVTEDELRQLITYVTEDGVDGAIILSAMLSLATDNAKEGSLGKLNAGTKTLGLYMFGIVLGMNFNELAEIMMSDSAREITKLMEGNAFDHKIGLNNIDSAINYIEAGPLKELEALFTRAKYPGIYTHLSKTIFKHIYKDVYKEDGKLDEAYKEIWEKASKNENGNLINDLSLVFLNFLDIIFKNNTKYYDINKINLVYSLASKMAIDEELVFGKSKYDINDNDKLFWEIIANYSALLSTIRTDTDNYYSIKTLARGASELKTLGLILKINQGLASKPDELIAFINKFESLCGSIKNEDGSETKFTLREFLSDPQKWINEYEIFKTAINILDVIDKTPHFKMYLEGLMVFDEETKTSSVKYRILRTLPEKAKRSLHGMSDELQTLALNSRLRKMVDDWIQTEFLLDSKLSFTIIKGLDYYDMNGNKVTAKSDTTISLGTFSGRASFKLWMEQVVIPNLKKGLNGDGDLGSYQLALKHNRFILDLKINGYNNTPNHINMNAYTLPINMSPRTDLEEVVFRKYKSFFNLFAQATNTGEMTEDKVYHTDGETWNIFELFFLYNIVAFLNLLGEANLKKIFEDLSNIGMIKKFYDFEALYDATSPITSEDIPMDYWKFWATPVGSVFGTSSSQIFSIDKNEFDRVLMRRATSKDFEDPDYTPRTKRNKYGKDYVKAGFRTFSPDFIGFSSEVDRLTVNISENLSVDAVISHERLVALILHKKVKDKKTGADIIEDETIYVKNPKKVKKATISENSRVTFRYDMTDLESQINNILNPC